MSLDLAALVELGEIDRKRIDLNRRLGRADELASPQRARVAEAQRALDKISEENKLGAREVTRLEGEIKSKQAEIDKANAGLNQASSNSEYQGFLRTIERCKQELSDLETQVLEAYEVQEERETNRQGYVKRLAEQEQELKAALGRVAEDKARLEGELGDLDGQRIVVGKRLSPEHLTLYEKILEKKGDHATASVTDDEMCKGCYMKVRPEQLSKIKGRSELVLCFTCGRILVPDS